MPSQTPLPTFASRAVVVVGMPAEYQRTAPNSSAFVPSVATIGLRRILPTRKPLIRPAMIAAPIASPIAGKRRLFTPAGYFVTITT